MNQHLVWKQVFAACIIIWWVLDAWISMHEDLDLFTPRPEELYIIIYREADQNKKHWECNIISTTFSSFRKSLNECLVLSGVGVWQDACSHAAWCRMYRNKETRQSILTVTHFSGCYDATVLSLASCCTGATENRKWHNGLLKKCQVYTVIRHFKLQACTRVQSRMSLQSHKSSLTKKGTPLWTCLKQSGFTCTSKTR